MTELTGPPGETIYVETGTEHVEAPPKRTRRRRNSGDAPPDRLPGEPLTIRPPGGAPETLLGGALALIDRLAHDETVNVDKLERIMALQERLIHKQAELDFNAAKARVLRKLAGIKIVKRREVDYGKGTGFKYAPLEEIDRVLGPLLAEEQMDLSYSEEPTAAGALVRGRLKHLPGGHYEDSTMSGPIDTSGGKNGMQSVGSTNSYLRRYIACNIFNIVVIGDDDDGSGGPINEAQLNEIVGLMARAGVGPKFLKYMKAPSVEEAGSKEAAVRTILARDYRKAVNTLNEQIAKKSAPNGDKPPDNMGTE